MSKTDKNSFKSKFFKDENLPFVESRYSVDSKQEYEKHFHTTLSIGIVEDGETSYTCQENSYTLKPNQLAIIEPNIIHSCNPSKNKARTYHMIYVDIQWCEEIQRVLFEDVNHFISLNSVQIKNKELFNDFLKLNKSLLDEKVFYLEKEELLEIFFIKLFNRYCNKSANQTTNKDKSKIQKTKEYIKNNCKENLTLDDIAQYVGISKFYLSKLFKQEVHLSIYKYLLNCKINFAKELLSKNYKSIEVANILGFFDQSHFISTFKKYVAATPDEYKKSIF
ncbi:MAG: AraC family transcriptional regulator [Arcobacter sp.]|nr:MAG: AraC family transcriptional regulator [Arcobacter sp.]